LLYRPLQDNKVNGVTDSTRIMGYSFLYPAVIPRPHVQTVTLTPQDEFFILGSRGLWDAVSPEEAVDAVRNVPDGLAAAKKLCSLAQSYGCRDNIGVLVVSLSVGGGDGCTCCPPRTGGDDDARPAHPELSSSVLTDRQGANDPGGVTSCGGGTVPEVNGETSASEVGSEAGSTASDEQPLSGLPAAERRPERHCTLHPGAPQGAGLPGGSAGPGAGAGAGPGVGAGPVSLQRQPSSAGPLFSSNLSDNGLDSDDEAPLDGVISNGSKLEVEVDIHCCAFQLRPGNPERPREPQHAKRGADFARGKTRWQNNVVVSATNGCLLAVCGREISDLKKSPSAASLFGKKLPNGSVVAPEDSHNLIEVALEAPKKKSGYFTAPAQQDPEDTLIVPPGLEQAVREQLKAQSAVVTGAPVPYTPPCTRDPGIWDHARAPGLIPATGPAALQQQDVYDTAL